MKKYIIASLLLVGVLTSDVSFAQQVDVDPNLNTVSCVVSLSNNLNYQSRDANTNGEVSLLQKFLQSKGYLNSEPTGYFGPLTLRAVKDFQTANSIQQTGYVGPITRGRIKTLNTCADVMTNSPITYTPTSNPSFPQNTSIPLNENNNTINNTVNVGTNSNSYGLAFHGVYKVGDYSITNFAHLAELKGVINTYALTYRPDLNAQELSNQLKANNTKVNLHLNFVNMFAEGERLMTNENGALDDYMEAMKIKLSRDSDLINQVSFIDLSEEWYESAELSNSKIANWTIFQGKDIGERRIAIRTQLEFAINIIKKYFPNIPIKIVDWSWQAQRVPPSNLDIIGIDSYFVPTSNLCDTEQKAIFDNSVGRVVSDAKSDYPNKKLYLVGNAFTDSRRVPLSPCQTQWYYDLAQTTGAVGLDWYLYTSDTSPVLPGFRENFPEQRAKIRLEGAKIVSQNNPQYSRNMLPKGSLESINNEVLTGWTYDPDHNSSPLTIKIYNGGGVRSGTLVGTTVTNILRSDINSKYGITGNHGFSFTWPIGVARKSVYVYVVDSDDSTGYSDFPISPIANIRTSSTSFRAGDTVSVSWDKIPTPHNNTWIGLYPSSASADTSIGYIGWAYARPNSASLATCSKNAISATSSIFPSASGSCSFTIPSSATPGTTYEFRLFSGLDGTTKIATSNAFSVTSLTSPAVSVVATTPYNTTPVVSLSFAYVPTTTSTAGTECRLLDSNQAPLTTTYQGSSPIIYNVPGSAGSYNYYIQCRDKVSITATAISNLITVNVSNVVRNVILQTIDNSVEVANGISISWENISEPSSNDWVGLYSSSSSGDSSFIDWYYARQSYTCSKVKISSSGIVSPSSSSCSFMIPSSATPGTTYEFRLFSGVSGAKLATSQAFTVRQLTNPSVPTLEVAGSSVQAGVSISVSWKNISLPFNTDWIGLYSSSASADSNYVDWNYTRSSFGSCSKSSNVFSSSGSCSFMIPSSANPGTTYEFRLFSNNGWTKLATSPAFTVVSTTTNAVSSTYSSNLDQIANSLQAIENLINQLVR